MGMSASQARLIALTARMNDIEYQGQQINQQRTTLSNQINALYSSLLSMDVPTPPSTQDFQKIEYSGSIGATKYSFDSTQVRPTKDNTYSVVLAQVGYGDTVNEKASFATVGGNATIKGCDFRAELAETVGTEIMKPEAGLVAMNNGGVSTNTAYGQLGNEIDQNNYNEYYNSKVYAKKGDLYFLIDGKDAINKGTEATDDYWIVYTYTLSGDTTNESEATQLGDNAAKSYVDNEGNQHYYTSKTANGAGVRTNSDPTAFLGNNQVAEKHDGEEGSNASLAGGYDAIYTTTGGDFPLYCQVTDPGSLGCDASDITSMYIQNTDGTVRPATTEDFEPLQGNKYKLKDGVTYISTKGGSEPYNIAGALNGKSVDGKGVFTFESLSSTGLSEETITSYKNAIANSNLKDANGEQLTYDKFYVILGQNGTAQFALKEEVDDGKTCSVYEYTPNGEYTVNNPTDGCKLTFDPSNGCITSIGIPVADEDGEIRYKTISLTATTVVDDAAYKDAYASYEYDKAVYDKTQEDINKKTSVIQMEDKNLELKLTRLDNERNAVNTEIEAVKKVVSDAIEKGFKTFSG